MKPFICKTIKSKIILSTTLFSFVLSIFIAGISYRGYHQYLYSNLIHSSELSLQVIADTINYDLRNILSLADWCQVNEAIGEFALHGARSAKQKLTVYDYLNERYNSNNSSKYMQRVLVTSNQSEFVQIVTIRHSNATDVFQVVRELDYFQPALHNQLNPFDIGFVYDPFKLQNQLSILPLIRPIYSLYNSDITGWIFIGISPNLFSDAIDAYHHSSVDSFYLTLGNNTYIYQNSRFYPAKFDDLVIIEDDRIPPLYQDTIIYNDPEQKILFISRPLNTSGCYITRQLNNQELVTQTNFFIAILLVICLVILLAGFIMSLFLNRMVNTPVNRIQEAMHKIAEGDFSRNTSIEWDNEFGDIGKGINSLSESILSLMHSRLEIEKQKKDYELQMLQSQVNPHFLYNTLLSIKWMASIQNAPGIAEMTTSLSRLLKNVSKGARQFIPLHEELELLMNYYTIMKYRYGGTIKIDINTDDDDLLQCGIPRFTLQPIVENSIFHGIEPKGATGSILVHIFRNDSGDLQIDITDDGIGMDEEKIHSILHDKPDSRSGFFKKIGISNVHSRIMLEFGNPYGLSIRSKPGIFTTVTVLLPDKPCLDMPSEEEIEKTKV